MSITGKWKVQKLASFGEDGPTLITLAEFMAMEQRDEEMERMASTILDITEDGRLNMLIPIPEDAVEEAKKEGVPVTDDGFVIADTFFWKEENGEYSCNNESTGTDDMPLTLNEDGTLDFMGGMLVFEKI